jgi:endonuclease III
MDATYGSSDNWASIVEGGQAKLQEAIKCGGLSAVKSKVILSILSQVQEKYGVYSLDHLFKASNDDAMQEMLSFQGVGPKTASCVLLFCMGRDSFAVDTHVHRITGLLGWRPAKASRDETHAHLEAKLPDEDKYALHVLFVQHGKVCPECKAGGRVKGGCELRKAFPGGRYRPDGDIASVKEELKVEMMDDTEGEVGEEMKPKVES